MSEHRKNYILPDIDWFVKITFSTLVPTLPNLVFALAHKLGRISKRNFICSFGALRLRED